MKRGNLLLFSILLIGVFLRFYLLGSVPPGVNQDEASIGYTAYSLLKTGKDEYGVPFPLSFQSFGDWKLPLYIYITIPSVALFGLSEITVRLPSAIFGSATIVLIYFLSKLLFKNDKVALFSAGFLAISPWHLHLSRVESESNVAVFLISLSIILLLKSFEKRKWLIIPSATGFALTYYTYAGNYIFTTLLIFIIFFLYKDNILQNKYFKTALFIFLTLFSIIGSQTIFGANTTKLSGISIYSDPGLSKREIESPRLDHDKSIPRLVLHNKITIGVEHFARNYLNSYSAPFLFFKGGEDKAHNIENFGNMYFVEAPLFLLGLIFLYNQRNKKEAKLLILWLLIAPIAAAITKTAPHTNRMFAVFPALPIVVSLGLYTALGFKKSAGFKIVAAGFISLFLLNALFYFDRYYVHFPANESQYWGNPYKEIVKKINEEKYKNRIVIFSRPEIEHYIFILFYTSFDPLTYQSSVVRYSPTSDKFMHVKKFGRFEFRDIDWSNDSKDAGKYLLIEFTKDIPPIVKYENFGTYEVKLPNKKSLFTIVEGK